MCSVSRDHQQRARSLLRSNEAMNLPLVSVIIPAFNHERLVARAIESVLGQSYSAIDLVVVDDGSSDDTWRVIQEVHARSVNTFRIFTKQNQGVSATLNYGVARSSGQ